MLHTSKSGLGHYINPRVSSLMHVKAGLNRNTAPWRPACNSYVVAFDIHSAIRCRWVSDWVYLFIDVFTKGRIDFHIRGGWWGVMSESVRAAAASEGLVRARCEVQAGKSGCCQRVVIEHVPLDGVRVADISLKSSFYGGFPSSGPKTNKGVETRPMNSILQQLYSHYCSTSVKPWISLNHWRG